MILMSGDEWAAARSKVLASHDPVLVKIYEWMLYREDYSGLPYSRISAFIERNPHWPNQTALAKTAERNMPVNLAPQDVMNWFAKHPPLTGRGIILLLNAGNHSGRSAEALDLIRKSWAEADITEDDTAKLMRVLGRSIPQSEQTLRLDRLLFAQKYTAARHLAKWMGKGYPELVEARIALAEDKPGAAGLIPQIPQQLRQDTGLQFERLSWRRRHDEDQGALDILFHAPGLDNAPNPEEWWKERHIMIRRMLEKHDYKTAYSLAARNGQPDKSSKAEAEWLAGWLALRFLNQPQPALNHFTVMYNSVSTAISKSRGAYWLGRTYDRLGKKPEAEQWYRAAANYPATYYGQLANRTLGLPPSRRPLPSAANRHTSFAGADLLQAILIARTARMDTAHSQLTTALIATLETPEDFMAAADSLGRSGDRAASFRIAKAASWKNIDLGSLTFPSLEKNMGRIAGDHALYHAIIRQESQFDSEARSPAGALGLMQLMPATAKETAGKLDIPHQTGWLTSRPDHNILLGSTYINRLKDRFDGALPLAIAGYNAGPGRVGQWIEEFGDPRTGKIDWIDWVELIPVAETRNYVQRVMENYNIYSPSQTAAYKNM